ncbi:AMIN-like domain-containing (lipo)protein [Streptomyces sp. YIM S03343]
MRRWATVLATLALVLTGAGAAPAVAATSQATACETGWGSMAKSEPGSLAMTGDLANVRTGRHTCYDRMVFDIPGMTTADPAMYWVQYVPGFAHVPSQTGIPVKGGAIIEVEITAPVDQSQYPVELADPLPGLDFSGYQTFRDAKFGGYYDGATHIGLGVRAKLPFRVLVLPDRVVVDVAHTW